MNTTRAWIIVLIIIILGVIGFVAYRNYSSAPVTVTPPPPPPSYGNLTQVYQNTTVGFSVRYPAGFIIDDMYQYQNLGPGKSIAGIKLTIPASLASGTNLGTDSYISVEDIPQTQNCTATLFLDQGNRKTPAQSFTDGNITYSLASTSGAAAGNRYDETVYAILGTNPCLAVRYFVHYGVIDNYPAGAVQQFDQSMLLGQFDAIRRTLVVTQ